jgi:twitching motility protein PilI
LVDEVFGLKHFQRNPEPLDTASDNPYLTGQVTQQDISWQVFSFQQLTADPRFLQAAA